MNMSLRRDFSVKFTIATMPITMCTIIMTLRIISRILAVAGMIAVGLFDRTVWS